MSFSGAFFSQLTFSDKKGPKDNKDKEERPGKSLVQAIVTHRHTWDVTSKWIQPGHLQQITFFIKFYTKVLLSFDLCCSTITQMTKYSEALLRNVSKMSKDKHFKGCDLLSSESWCFYTRKILTKKKKSKLKVGICVFIQVKLHPTTFTRDLQILQMPSMSSPKTQ